jgi:hypothetical protein
MTLCVMPAQHLLAESLELEECWNSFRAILALFTTPDPNLFLEVFMVSHFTVCRCLKVFTFSVLVLDLPSFLTVAYLCCGTKPFVATSKDTSTTGSVSNTSTYKNDIVIGRSLGEMSRR